MTFKNTTLAAATTYELTLGPSGLRVKDLQTVTDYYVNTIGMQILARHEGQVVLGVQATKEPLLVLYHTPNGQDSRHKTGLYHNAFLLPSRAALGNFLHHLIRNRLEIVGAADHGYSEAIYLEDPEGNGIEVYRDKERSVWDIREDGQIAGVTEPLDGDGVYEAATDPTAQQLPAGTKVGHVHLKVADLKVSSEFYQRLLGLDLKFQFGPAANFLSYHNYHHHIGMNVWTGRNQPAITAQDLGLAYWTVYVQTPHQVTEVVQQLEAQGQVVTNLGTSVMITDPNGIHIRLMAQSLRQENLVTTFQLAQGVK